MNQKGKILVTGGTGYIGSHTTVELIEAGYEVVVVDNLSNSDASVLEGIYQITGKRIPFVHADCCDKQAMEQLFETYRFESVIHFAASKVACESLEKPIRYYRNNLLSLLNLIEVMEQYECNQLLFSSSCMVYGNADELPVTEQTPRKQAITPYGNTKRIAEDMLFDATRAMPALRAISLRYFNPIGAHPSALIGERTEGIPQNLVPYLTQTAAGIRDQLAIFGKDYPTPDGTCIRDYIDVVDLAKAHVKAIDRLQQGGCQTPYEVYNIGTGRGVSVMELVERFEAVNGVKINYRIAPRRLRDIVAIWADPSKANKELGWKTERSLDETLAAAWKWQLHQQ